MNRNATAIGMVLLLVIACRAQFQPASATEACPVTTPTTELAPTPSPLDGYDPFPAGIIWYRNADRTIWAHPWEPWQARHDIKVGWIRPRGARLAVNGQRLDRHAAPLQVGLPCCYPDHFQASGLTFPTAGCWVVQARAGQSRLRFVVYVPPRRTLQKPGA